MAALGGKTKTSALGEGQQMRVQIAPGATPANARQVTRVVLYGETGIEGIAAINDRGTFVSVAPPTEDASGQKPVVQADAGEEDDEDSGSGPRLYQSLYETAGRHDIPRATVEDIVRVFSYDLDFQRRVQSGDGLDVFYTYDEEARAPTGRTFSMPRSPSGGDAEGLTASNPPTTAPSTISMIRAAP